MACPGSAARPEGVVAPRDDLANAYAYGASDATGSLRLFAGIERLDATAAGRTRSLASIYGDLWVEARPG